MLTAIHRTALGTSSLALALGLVAGCGGGRGSDSAGGSTSFRILSISVPNNGIWQINRPIEFTFNQDIDFSSVNLNTINITQPTGTPAAGEFQLRNSRQVTFQPACPTLGDYSDSGLLPNGIAYRINVLGSTSGGPTVRSSAGRPLTASQVVDFTTPLSALLDPTILFLDPASGPPTSIVRQPGDTSTLAASYVELGGDSSVGAREYFTARTTPAPDLGAEVEAGFKAPLNLYSDSASSVSIVVALNQPVDPSSSNISPENLKLEYQDQVGNWVSLAHVVQLVENCTGTGALVRITPTGILPQGRIVRVVLSSNFKDLVGEFNIADIVVGSFEVDVATDPGTTTPGDGGDVVAEYFTDVSFEDRDSVLSAPRAVWSSDGKLAASFAFDGTGGQDGAFDWVIDGTFVLDTTFSVITDITQTRQQSVVNGRVDVRSLWVKPTGTLIIQGVKPCTILCSGTIDPTILPVGTAASSVLIQGLVKCSGTNNRGVVSFSTANIPEVGAAGQAGGGDGGTGNYLTTQSTPQGGTGYGAFGAPGGGGFGGESGYNASGTATARRPAGGGGGRFGPNQFERTRPTCPDQRMIGLDAEPGFNGAGSAFGALHPGVLTPVGGAIGPSLFVDNNPSNDFWGTMVTTGGQVVQGELVTPMAGTGGGGGGSACMTSSFPTTPFTPQGDEKGAGGGGGGGSLAILALGDIRFAGLGAAARGRIEVNGGTGGGGENTNGIDRIGGGSGGGSGGHLILQSASQIDLSRCTATSTSVNGLTFWGGLYARGGQGGEGQDGTGGARANGVETTPIADSLPSNSYPATSGTSAPCAVFSGANDAAATVGGITNPPQFQFTNNTGVKVCAGGDGGPGIIQLHTPRLTDIIVPATATPPIANVDFRAICLPLPVGATPTTANAPSTWNQLLPTFGRLSVARSKWIPLGAAGVPPPPSAGADTIRFQFPGTDTSTGIIRRSGSGASATVLELPAILSGALVANPSVPSITSDLRSVVFDASTLADDIYKRTPAILKGFELKMTAASSAVNKFEVVAATYDAALDQLRVTVGTSGTPLAGYAVGDTAELIPRFFRVSTEGSQDSYPSSAAIRIRFQATTPNSLGQPDESALAAFTDDITTLNSSTVRFVRFQVEFDIQADGGSLSATTPIPALEFLAFPFKF